MIYKLYKYKLVRIKIQTFHKKIVRRFNSSDDSLLIETHIQAKFLSAYYDPTLIFTFLVSFPPIFDVTAGSIHPFDPLIFINPLNFSVS